MMLEQLYEHIHQNASEEFLPAVLEKEKMDCSNFIDTDNDRKPVENK